MAKGRVEVLRRKVWNEDIQAEVLTVWGYRAACSCGHRGERRFIYSTARRDLAAHRDWWHRNRGTE